MAEDNVDKKEEQNKRSEPEYERIDIRKVENGPDQYSVVLTWPVSRELKSGTSLRISVNGVEFPRVKLNESEQYYSPADPEELLPPNNVCSFKVNGKPSPDEEIDLKKIVQPSYAIGMKIISNEDYNNLKNEFFSQSELSLGLIIPLILIVLGLSLMPHIGLGPSFSGGGGRGLLHSLAWSLICVSLPLICYGLFVIGAERYQKFRIEVKLLILGNWRQQQEAKKKAASSAASTDTTTVIQKAVAKAIDKTLLSKGSLNVRVDAKG